MEKRSQISIQFSWIFILVAGALILLFFTSLVFRQQEISEQKLSATVLNQIDTILTGSGLSSGTVNIIDTPEIEMEFICDADGYSEYSIIGTALTKETPYDIYFSPGQIQGRQIISWALEFDAPFKVSNFLYISDPNTKYVFVNPPVSGYGADMLEDFPPEFISQKVAGLDEINAEGYSTVRLVYFDAEPSGTISWSEEIDTSAVKVTQGTVTFYQRQGTVFVQQGSLPYINIPSAYGAIFAYDFTFYSCTMKKALRKLSLVSRIYSERESQIKSYFQSNPSVLGCELYYQGQISELVEHSADCSQDLEACLPNVISDVNNIESNQNVLIRRTCPLIY